MRKKDRFVIGLVVSSVLLGLLIYLSAIGLLQRDKASQTQNHETTNYPRTNPINEAQTLP